MRSDRFDAREFITRAAALPGVPGYEAPVAEYIAACMEPLCDDVRIDALYNAIGRLGDDGPRIILCAHQDEIGLMVLSIEKDGAIRLARNGGVDPRILPGLEVIVNAASGPLPGVVGAKAPHLLKPEDHNKAVKLEDVYVDIGYPAARVRELVRIGDTVTLTGAPVCLDGEIMAGKTMDDRACVAVMLECAALLSTMKHRAQVFLVAASQEEIGSKGAATGAYALQPDIAVVLDVTHGEGPGTGKFEAYPLDKLISTIAPCINRPLYDKLFEVAKRHRVELGKSVKGGGTSTDADTLAVSRAGVPTLLLEVPLRYMHTTVETLSLNTIREAGRLLAHFICDISMEWEAIAWH